MTAAPHVLVVDDDRELCELLTMRIEAHGYAVTVGGSVTAALEHVGRTRFDAVVLDLRLGDEDGFTVLDGITKRTPDVPVIVLTAHGTIDTAVEAMRRGAFGFATKPFHHQDLLQRIAQAVERHRLKSEVAALRRVLDLETEVPALVGASPAIEGVRKTIARVGSSASTVLVLGESGTGKELVARHLHAASPRAAAPFVTVNCAGLAEETLEGALFGRARTGDERDGLLRAARGGTLFFDEVAELAAGLQARLLRVLDDQRFRSGGALADDTADVRVIAATNHDLLAEVAEKRFRQDLYYRLNVVPLFVPPLRDRAGDVTLLAELFLDRAAARQGTPVPRISPRALSALVGHAWPGNVRELENVMEAALLLCREGEIDVEHLPGVGATSHAPPSVTEEITRGVARVLAPWLVGEASDVPPLRDLRDIVERAYLEMVLSRASGNVSLAAKIAGRNRTDLYDLLRRHGISAAAFKRSD